MDRIIITSKGDFVFVSKITCIEVIFDRDKKLYQLIANFSNGECSCLFTSKDIDLIVIKQNDLFAFLISNVCYFSFDDNLIKE